MNLGIRRESADTHRVIGSRDDARAVRTMRNRVLVPGIWVDSLVDNVEAEFDALQIHVSGGSARIHDTDLDSLPSIIAGKLIEPHGFLTPSQHLLPRKIGE